MRKNNKGFTIIELIIYMGILAFILIVLTDILTAVFNVQLSTESGSQVSQDGRYIYNKFIFDVDNASSISAPLNLGSTSATLSFTRSSNNYTYSLDGNNLKITDPSGTYVLNSPDTKISGLSFKRIGNTGGKPTIRINFTVTGNIQGQKDTAVFQTTAGLR